MNSRPKLIMIMGMQRSGTTALFETLATASRLVSRNESPGDAIYDDYYLRPEPQIRSFLAALRVPVLLKPVRESERRPVSQVVEEYRNYDLRILWLYRDPVNVLYSYLRKGWTTEQSLFINAREWDRRNRELLRDLPAVRDQTSIVRYEDLIGDPATLTALTRSLGLSIRSTLRPDSDAGRSKLPGETQRRIDLLTRSTLRALDEQRSFRPAAGAAASTGRRWAWRLPRLLALPCAPPAITSEQLAREPSDPRPDFYSEAFVLAPHTEFNRWRGSGPVQSLAWENSSVWLGYDAVRAALTEHERLRPEPPGESRPVPLSGEGGGTAIEPLLAPDLLESRVLDRVDVYRDRDSFELGDLALEAVCNALIGWFGVTSDWHRQFFCNFGGEASGPGVTGMLDPAGWLARRIADERWTAQQAEAFQIFGSFYIYVLSSAIVNAVQLLMANAPLGDRFREDPAARAGILAELDRLSGPILVTARTAHAAWEHDGVAIPAGSQLFLALAAANRDPAVYPEPERIIPERYPQAPLPLQAYGPELWPGGLWQAIGSRVVETVLRVLLADSPPLQRTNPAEPVRWTLELVVGLGRQVLAIPFDWRIEAFPVRFASAD